MKRTFFALAILGGVLACLPVASCGQATPSKGSASTSETSQDKTRPDLRPTFMGKAYDIQGGEFDGKRGYLFRIWNRSGRALNRRSLPGRFNRRRKVLAYLSTGAAYSDGTLSFAERAVLGDELFTGERERLNPSPSGEFADRPANCIVVVEPDIDRIVYTLQGRTATASYAAADVEVLKLGEVVLNPDLPPMPGETEFARPEGVDVNDNGVRDEVEIILHENYSENPEVLNVLMAGAREKEIALSFASAGNQEALWQHKRTIEGRYLSYCLVGLQFERGYPGGWASSQRRRLNLIMLNTPERQEVYRKQDELMNGFKLGFSIGDGLSLDKCLEEF